MGSSPLVSVVTPCFNATAFIPEALNSLRAQTFRDFEIILTNDGCPDTENLERVLEPYRNEIVYLKSGHWTSISESRNKAIQASRAKYIALLDSDDVWEPEFLQVLVAKLESDPTLDLVFPDATYFGEGAGSWAGKRYLEKNPCEDEVTLEKLISRESSIFICVAARRECVLRAGMFDPNIRGGEDWDLWIRMKRCGGRLACIRQPLARYRLRQGSMSSDKLDLLRNGLSVCSKYLHLPDITGQERLWFEAIAEKYQANMDVVQAKQALYARRANNAIALFLKANAVLKNRRINLTILALRLVPTLVYTYIHSRYSNEYAYLH